MSAAVALIGGLGLGALGSLHCAGMCGPLVLACTRAGRTRPHPALDAVAYQAARVGTYVAIGLAFGYFGASLRLLGGQRAMAILAGVLLIVVGLAGRRLERAIGRAGWFAGAYSLLARYAGRGSSAVLGAVNGLLPCGLVYTALAASFATGDLASGAALMLGFGLATVPSLLLAGWLGGRLGRGGLAAKLFSIAAVSAGAVSVYRGLAASLPLDWVNYLAANPQLSCH